jgi:ABC-2 type transport system permease protein
MGDIGRIARRVLMQLRYDPRYLFMSCLVPVLLVLLLEALFTGVPGFRMIGIDIAVYAMPAAAFFIFFLNYLVCTIVLVRERREGTLSRMFAAGYRRWAVILGYVAGYTSLAFAQTLCAIVATLIVFDLPLDQRMAWVLLITLTLSVVSLALGVFVSTMARSEGQIFPTIPLIIVPSLLLSGFIIPLEHLPRWLRAISYAVPLTYAEKLLVGVMKHGTAFGDMIHWYLLLLGYGVLLLAIASITVRESE